MSNPKTRRAQTIIKPDRDRRFVTEDNPFEAMMSRFDDAAGLLLLPGRHDLEIGLHECLVRQTGTDHRKAFAIR